MVDIINPGRLKVSDALTKVVSHYFGKNNISEALLKQSWIEEIASYPNLTENGWYNPPHLGAAILACNSNDVTRSHFKSFRDSQFFQIIKLLIGKILFLWRMRLMLIMNLAFLPILLLLHILVSRLKYAHILGNALMFVMNFSNFEANSTSGQAYLLIDRIASENGLEGKTWSSTDNDYNFGHTLPSLYDLMPDLNNTSKELSDISAQKMRKSRQFLSGSSDWNLSDSGQFTIDPQFIVPSDISMPKVMIHYVVDASSKKIKVCNSCEHLPRMLGLL
ncbi:hypothetical protein [Marinomonas rhodophyticola]|uniref:Uncharacterized protein n=1 Tax=Marinomonas rhodophyticola TaxID=2992803 RepID=A0ABT3KFD9_9GAMM|nr:hypothetical protein [Marinomonas sp. KJ51-3]MCW4628891.1 hypothetical protein [Marinomonas sp. KJ51-3]